VWQLPEWLGGRTFSFNPGPFNVKEHALIVIMANVGVSQVYGLHLIVAGQLFYNRTFEFGFAFLFILTTQLTGFAIAGLARRYVVWPASMIWPEALVVATNLNAFHAEEDAFQGGVSRLRFLVYILIGSTLYYWIPGKCLGRSIPLIVGSCDSRIPFYRAFVFLVGNLDPAEEQGDQPTVWRQFWSGHEYGHP
jgi:hypothetical protein